GSINFNNYPYVLYFDASDGPIDVLINSKVSLEGQAEICVNDNGGKNRVRFFMYGKDADFKFASNNGNLAGHVFRVQDDTLTPKNETVDDCGVPILNAVPTGWGSEVSFSDHELTTKDYNYGGANGGIPELYVFGVVNPDETPGPDDAPGGVFRVGGSGNVVTFRGYILSKYTDVICSYEGAPVFCGTVYCRNLQNLTANTSACIECHVPTSKKYTKAVQDIWS
ncbi:MAG: hypothetical protein IJ583_10500, partial [Firmicutes bacterium]|nr:hypothetical protein [Bacillota bacterium]